MKVHRQVHVVDAGLGSARRALSVASVLTALLLLFACGGGSAGSGNSAIDSASFSLTLGDINTLTGDEAVFGPPFAKAADLGAQVVNDALKADGIKIDVKVDHADDQTTPDGAVSAARKLVADGATCLSGSIPSANTIAIANAVSIPQHIPQISPASTSVAITRLKGHQGLLFRTIPGDLLQTATLARVVRDKIGSGKTLSLAARNDVFGQGFISGFKTAWEKNGGKSLGPVLYDPGAPSYDSEAQKIVAGNPDGFVIIDFPANYAKVGAALLRTGQFDARKLFIAGGQPSTIPAGVPAASMEGAIGTRPGSPSGSAPSAGFDNLFANSPGTKVRQSFDQNNFDNIVLCSLAAIASGSNRPGQIAGKIRAVSGPGGTPYTFKQLGQAIKDLRGGKTIHYMGVSGAIEFDANGDPQAGTYDVYQYVNGKLVVMRQVQAKA